MGAKKLFVCLIIGVLITSLVDIGGPTMATEPGQAEATWHEPNPTANTALSQRSTCIHNYLIMVS